MKNNSPFNVLDDVARDYIPDHASLVPRLAARLERKSLMGHIRSRPLVAILIALLILLALTGAAYALGKALGYIPGVGLVSRDTPLRVLGEPVSLTRDGITVTVEEAVLSADKTLIRFTLNGVPADQTAQDITKCDTQWGGLTLPDGSTLQTIGGYGLDSWDLGYEARFTFQPVPADVNQATFVPPCLQYYLPGEVPENWRLPLRFTAAPSDLTVAPVLEITSSRDASGENPMVLEKVVETEKGYILVGKFHSTDLPHDQEAVAFPTWPKIMDANGREIPYTFPNMELDLPLEKTEPGVFAWAFEIDGKSFTSPLTITSGTLRVEVRDAQSQFEFDAGPNPQDGQVWQDLNIDFEVAGHPVRVVSAIRTSDGYQFSFESKSSTVFGGVQLTIGDSTQGLTGMDSSSRFSSEVKFVGRVPSGKLTVQVTRPLVDISGSWQLQWQPDKPVSATLPLATQSPQACLTLDSWKAALAKPAPIPTGLNNKVLVSGRVIEDGKPLSEENTGIYISKLDGSDRKQILQGHNWASPSLSPNGLQVVYDGTGHTGADGLDILDLASGNTLTIPNTTADDMAPLWSPDGTRIAFIRFNEKDLYLIHPDGSGLRKITTGPDYEQPVGWWPDGSAFIYATEAEGGALLRKLDVNSGSVSDLFVVAADLGVAVSPDGSEIAFEDREPPASIGLYVSRLDGSSRRLIVSMNDYLGVGSPQWSRDGKWLLVNVLDTPNMDNADAAAALVNLQTCQLIPVPITGTIRSWVP